MDDIRDKLLADTDEIKGYQDWLYFDEFVSIAIEDLAEERDISKTEMFHTFAKTKMGKNIGRCNPGLFLAFDVGPEQIAQMYNEREAKAREKIQFDSKKSYRASHVLFEPATQQVIEQVKTICKKQPDYIDYSLSAESVLAEHPELSDNQKTDLTLILSKFKDEYPRNYIIKTIENSKTIGYLQLMQTDTITPSIVLYVQNDARENGYGYDALMAMITALQEESVYTALYFIANTADAASISLAEKCPLQKKVMNCPELEQFVKMYRIEL